MSPLSKGILFVGGCGHGLYPLSLVEMKQLQPVYDKPMIYYPLSVLMMAGIRDVLVISTPAETPRLEGVLGDGSRWGVSLRYRIQSQVKGIGHAFLIAEDFLAGDGVCLILGDNIFYGRMGLDQIANDFQEGATIFGYPVKDPERFEVVEVDDGCTVLSIEEKPSHPRSNHAVPGLHLYDNEVVAVARTLRSKAGKKLDIVDIHREYLRQGKLHVRLLGRGIAWFDTDTHMSLLEAGQFIGTLEARQGLKIACLEEVAFRSGFINLEKMEEIISGMPKSNYRAYLEAIAMEHVR